MYKRLQSLQALNLPDIKKLLEQTLNDIKEENNQLHKHLNELTITSEASDLKRAEEQSAQRSEQEQPVSFEQLAPNKDHAHFESLLNTTEEVEYEPSLHGQILQLHAKGLTHEEIAQRLNCGKTEVELILRFQQKD